MATGTKPARKSGTSTSKPSAKPSGKAAKQSAKQTKATPKVTAADRMKMSPAQLRKLNLRKVTLTSGSGKTRKSRVVLRPVALTGGGGKGASHGEFVAAASYASQLVCTDASGQPIGRAPISTEQVAKVAALLKKQRKTPAASVHALVGGKSAKASAAIAVAYADGKLGRTELPDGMGGRIADESRKIGEPTKHKLSGKAWVAVLVALAKYPAKS
jgi:hypothetical protein